VRLIIYTGKGGTGKTVTSCSTAIKLAEYGHKTLVISSDPAHTLSDAFMMPDISYQVQEILPKLNVLQIDPVTEMRNQFDTTLSYMASIFSAKGIDETLAYEIAMLPGMTQLFSLLKVEELAKQKRFDVIVIDMPASGEALRYLYFPKLVGSIGRKMAGLLGMFSGVTRIFQVLSKNPMPTKDNIQVEADILNRIQDLSEIIQNNDMTSIRLVVNPDTFSIENAKRALMSASLFGINVDLTIINKIMPYQTSDRYYANWAVFQRGKVEEARANFYPLPLKEIHLQNTELRGLEMLRKNGELLFGNEDPSQIYYRGKAISFATEENSLRMTVKVPFTEKDDFDLERHGDQLTIKVKNPVGYIANIIPLPSAALTMKLVKAKLNGDELNVIFTRGI
jgi:arsenite/tail-anchored protein-transporting ATPase